MNLNKLPCANTHYLNRYMADLDREDSYETAMEHYAAEIAADLMSSGYCNVQIGRRIARIDWEDFLLMVDEQDAWGRLEQDKDELFAQFCADYAPYRAAFMEDE